MSPKINSFLFLLLSILATPCFSATLYVDDDPGSLNLGTLAEPYTSIQTALNVAVAGDIIQVRDGIYNEKLWWSNSGTSGNPITLQNFPGEAPVLTGTGIISQTPMIVISSKSFVVIDGLQIQDNYMQDARGIHVLGEGSDITIQNCIITQIGFTSVKDTDPTSVSPTGQGHGILINGRTTTGYTNITILNNELSCLVTGNSEALTLVGNVSGFTIEGNSIFDNTNIGIDIAGHFAWAIDGGVSATLNQARNGIISSNTVYNNRRFNNVDAPAGIYVDGGAEVLIECNTVYQNGTGISVGCENVGQTASGVTIRNNFIYDNDNHGIVLGANNGNILDCTVRNNTCFKNGNIQNFTSEINLQNSTDCAILNNILYARSISHYGISIFAYTANNMTVSDNLLFREGGDLSNLIVGGDGSMAPADVNTMQVDPLLQSTSLPSPNLHLQASSPAKDMGSNTDVSGGEEDIDKETRIANTTVDLGADEIQTVLSVDYSMALRAAVFDNYISLHWATEAEISANRFELEKSTDLKRWHAIGTVVVGQSPYVFKDKNPVLGLQYYRLKQIDWDGRFEYSDMATASWGLNKSALLVYPNPSSGIVQIEGVFERWDLYSLEGQWLRSGTSSIIRELPIGVFLLYIHNPGSTEGKILMVNE